MSCFLFDVAPSLKYTLCANFKMDCEEVGNFVREPLVPRRSNENIDYHVSKYGPTFTESSCNFSSLFVAVVIPNATSWKGRKRRSFEWKRQMTLLSFERRQKLGMKMNWWTLVPSPRRPYEKVGHSSSQKKAGPIICVCFFQGDSEARTFSVVVSSFEWRN